MSEQILLSSISLDGVREQGGFGQPLHTLYQQLRLILSIELGEDSAALLAEPVVDKVRNRIDWYTQGDAGQMPLPLEALPEAQRTAVLAQVQEQLTQGREVAERYLASGNAQRMQLGAALKAVLQPVDAAQVLLLHERPLLVYWGFVADRPWEVLPSTVACTPAASAPALENTTPARVQPANTAQLVDAPAPSAPTLAAVPTVAEAPMPTVAETVVAEPKVAIPPSTPPGVEPSIVANPAAPAPSAQHEQRPMLQSSSSARYFWLALLLLVLIAIAIFFWVRAGKPLPWVTTHTQASIPAHRATLTNDAELPNAAPAPLPTTAQPSTADASQPPAPTPALVTPNTAPHLAAPAAAPEPEVASAPPSRLATPPPAAQAAMPPANTVENALLTSSGAPQKIPPAAHSAAPQQQPSAQTAQRPTTSVEQNLEQVLSTAQPSAEAAVPQQVPALPVEPTAAERREFAERLSASGAARGAISASLLWNGNADLDLVVICPSGQSVDYQNPSGCAGKLDVDANALRDRVQDKPVENIFWAAAAAEPGTYKVAVRYKPRKDERQPQPTPFQLRLNHDQREQVFKGMAQPGKLLTVTTFTVPER